MKKIKITSNGIKQAIDDLVDENERLQDKIYKQNDEIERLNNIIDSLANFINLALEIYNNVDIKTLNLVKNKLQELKRK